MKRALIVILLLTVIAGLGSLAWIKYQPIHAEKVAAAQRDAAKAQDATNAAVSAERQAGIKRNAEVVKQYNAVRAQCLVGQTNTKTYNALATVKVKAAVPDCGAELLE